MLKQVSYNYCSKTFNVGIFIFKHSFVSTRYYSKPCISVPEKIEVLMMKVVSNAKKALTKKKMLNSLKQIDNSEKSE